MKKAKASGKKPATEHTSAPRGQPRSHKPKLFMRMVTATRTDEPKPRVYLINFNELEGEQAAAVEIRNGRPYGLPTVINLAVGRWTLDGTPPSDPSGSLAALVRLAASSRAKTKAFNAASPEEQAAIIESRMQYSDDEKKRLKAQGLVPQCDFKPDGESMKWTAACEWDRWDEEALQWDERAARIQRLCGMAVLPTRTFKSTCQRGLGLKIVKRKCDAHSH